MRSLFIIALLVFVFIFHTQLWDFVRGNAEVANTSITKWLVDHTPKHE